MHYLYCKLSDGKLPRLILHNLLGCKSHLVYSHFARNAEPSSVVSVVVTVIIMCHGLKTGSRRPLYRLGEHNLITVVVCFRVVSRASTVCGLARQRGQFARMRIHRYLPNLAESCRIFAERTSKDHHS